MQSKTWGTGEGEVDSHMKDSRRLNIKKFKQVLERQNLKNGKKNRPFGIERNHMKKLINIYLIKKLSTYIRQTQNKFEENIFLKCWRAGVGGM